MPERADAEQNLWENMIIPVEDCIYAGIEGGDFQVSYRLAEGGLSVWIDEINSFVQWLEESYELEAANVKALLCADGAVLTFFAEVLTLTGE